MAYTNVYKGSYDDLSELTVNADSMKSAIEELARIKADREPTILRKTINGIQVPDPPAPPVTVTIRARAEMEDGATIALPDTVTVRPETAVVEKGSAVLLYAIDTAEDPTVEFVGWYLGTERISTSPNFAYDIPESAEEVLDFTARYAEKPSATVTLTVTPTMADGESTVPSTCIVRPQNSIELPKHATLALYAIVTDPAYEFVSWQNAEGEILSVEDTYLYTIGEEDTEIFAVFDEV